MHARRHYWVAITGTRPHTSFLFTHVHVCRLFSQIVSREEKLAVMERLTNRDEDHKLTVRMRAPVKPVS